MNIFSKILKLFHPNGKMKQYVQSKENEAYRIKDDIQTVLEDSRVKIREKNIEINKHFSNLDIYLSDVSQKIALATGARRRIKR